MVPFAGYSMPIQYKDSIMDSTQHCRTNGSIFDVSHMCGLTLKGKDVVPFLEKLVVADVAGLKDGSGTLSCMTNERGGIIDDTIVTRVTATELYVVVNAGCRDKDLAHIGKHLAEAKKNGMDVSMHVHDERGLLAVQGPAAVEAMQKLVKDDLSKLYFSQFRKMDVAGASCFVTRTGYTGEDGFELSIPNDKLLAVTEALLKNPRMRLCGLGARDSLRLEAGLCLYGNDLNEDITPVEAGLAWCVGKRRREKFDFIGGDVVKKQLAEGVTKRRVGLINTGAPARAHADLVNAEGKKVGEVTSGGFSPCLKKNIAMGYVDKGFDKAGTKLKVVVRGKSADAEVTKMPFVNTT